MAVSDPVTIAVVSTVGGVAISYITNVLAKKQQANKAAKQPKDRTERMFDGYERLIKQKDLEDARKEDVIKRLSETIKDLEHQLTYTKTALSETKDQLRQSREESEKMNDLLAQMRKEYQSSKTVGGV